MIAGGIGCRKGCAASDIVAALAQALASGGHALADVVALYAPLFKRDERGLSDAAAQLGKPLVLVSLDELQAHAGSALTHSPVVMERFGVPSIAETAALAGAARAHAHVRLLGPRRRFGNATCALAGALQNQEQPS